MCRYVAAAPYFGIHHRRFVTPVNLGFLALDALLYLGALLIEPSLYDLWTLLIRFLDRLFRGESPTLEVVANAAHRQLDSAFTFNQLHDGRPVPECKFHLQLFGALVADDLPNSALLRITSARKNRRCFAG